MKTTNKALRCVHTCLGKGVGEGEQCGRPHAHEHWLLAEGGVGTGGQMAFLYAALSCLT